jgi:hypothetical protein
MYSTATIRRIRVGKQLPIQSVQRHAVPSDLCESDSYDARLETGPSDLGSRIPQQKTSHCKDRILILKMENFRTYNLYGEESNDSNTAVIKEINKLIRQANKCSSG